MTKSRAHTVLPGLAVLLGCALRLGAYHANYPVTIDEAALARNLIDRSWTGLLAHLDYAQLAPVAFLLVEKLVASLFGYGSHALRLFPLGCGMLSVWLCWAVSRRIMAFEPAVVSVTLFAIANPLIAYSATIKQYSTDVAATVLVVLLAVRLRSLGSGRRFMWLGIVGVATAFFSFTASFVLAGAAVTCFLFGRRESDSYVRRSHVVVSAVWATGAGLGAWLGWLVATPADLAYMKWFWVYGFMPFPPANWTDVLWLWTRLQGMFGQTGEYRASIGWLGLAVIGLWSFHCRRRDVSLLVAVPVILTLVASALRLYPFAFGRTQLFLLPLFLILASEGSGYCLRAFGQPYRWVGAAPMILILVLACSSTLAGSRESVGRGTVSVMDYLKDHRRPGDRTYVLYRLGQVFQYYAPQYRISPEEYDVGACYDRTRELLREVDAFRDSPRVWMLMSSSIGDQESESVVKYLDAIGTKVDEFAPDGAPLTVFGTFVYLYDLTSSPRSLAVSADNFPLPPVLNQAEPWRCYGVFQSVRR